MGPNKIANLDRLTGSNLKDAVNELDDKQILSLFQQLIDEREALVKRQEHLVSLSRLSEKTIAAADEVAAQIKAEAKTQAETQTNMILSEAHSNAQRIIADSRSQAIAATRNELIAARTKYFEELDIFTTKSINDFEAKIISTLENVASSLTSCTENLKNQLCSFKKEMESKLVELDKTTFPDNSTARPDTAVQPPVRSDHNSNTNAGREMRIVEILAPRDKERIESVRAHLDMLEDVVETNIRHLVDRTLIEVTLLKPVDLTRIMADWAEVEMAQELVVEGKPRTQVTLGVETEIAEERDLLNHKINRIAHRIRPVGV